MSAQVRRLGNPNMIKGAPSVNPSGRPQSMERMVRERVLAIDPATGKSEFGQILDMLIDTALGRNGAQAAARKDRIKAAEIILDRGWGKATQTVDITAEVTTPSTAVALTGLTDEQLQALEAGLGAVLLPTSTIPAELRDEEDELPDPPAE